MKHPGKLFIALVIMITSCKKDTRIFPAVNSLKKSSSLSYLPMAPGNYWVYAVYSQDTSGSDTFMQFDSIYVQKDTMIGSTSYHVLSDTITTMGVHSFFCYGSVLTDSSGFILRAPGYGAIFGRVDFDPVHLNDTIAVDTASYGVIRYWVPSTFNNDVVPAGNFSGISMNIREYFLGTNPHSIPGNVTYAHYAPGVGLCYYKCGFASGGISGFVWKLLRYHV